jgi:hypothetical protein
MRLQQLHICRRLYVTTAVGSDGLYTPHAVPIPRELPTQNAFFPRATCNPKTHRRLSVSSQLYAALAFLLLVGDVGNGG